MFKTKITTIALPYILLEEMNLLSPDFNIKLPDILATMNVLLMAVALGMAGIWYGSEADDDQVTFEHLLIWTSPLRHRC